MTYRGVSASGAPLDSWEVTLSGQETWTRSFELATDTSFMGFQATPELAQARPRIVVRATHVTDAHERRDHPQVTATLRVDTATFYFLDHYVWLEPSRFWTWGGASGPHHGDPSRRPPSQSQPQPDCVCTVGASTTTSRSRATRDMRPCLLRRASGMSSSSRSRAARRWSTSGRPGGSRLPS